MDNQYKFCKKCKLDSGEEKESSAVCHAKCSQGKAECLEYDYKKIASDLPEVKNKNGETQEFKSNVFGTENGELIIRGESRIENDKDMDFKVRKENDIWEFYDEEKEGGVGWIPFTDWYLTSTHESVMSKKIMKENMEHIPQMIDDKLREFNFYTIDPKKGKQKISFTDDDRESMKNSFLDMSEKYPKILPLSVQ